MLCCPGGSFVQAALPAIKHGLPELRSYYFKFIRYCHGCQCVVMPTLPLAIKLRRLHSWHTGLTAQCGRGFHTREGIEESSCADLCLLWRQMLKISNGAVGW